MTETPATVPAESPPGGSTSPEVVPPQVATTPGLESATQQAEDRRFSEHVEMAINLGIGFTLAHLKATEISVKPHDLEAFVAKYRVTQTPGYDEDGKQFHTISIVERA